MAGSGNPSIMTLVGGTSTQVAGAPNIWQANQWTSPFSVGVSVDVNSTATTPAWSLYVTNDSATTAITASSSSASSLVMTSTTIFPNSSVVWFSSFAAAQSSNAFVGITTPFKYLTIAATAGTSNQIITATIVQAG